MTIEEALASALAFERKVQAHYEKAREGVPEGEAREFFGLMAAEEARHVEYLEHKREQWLSTGAIGPTEVESAVPRRDWLQEGKRRLAEAKGHPDRSYGLGHLEESLRLEEEVSAHYRQLVDGVDDPEAKALFRRFLEIEDGHTALVRAELDYVTGTGHFLGIREFTLD
ncbi:MAG: hypothetical protein D6708_01205 [Candidatus Dadabacteria bacterium]|nr:MAG: hypothetical protein D6708_01205 [Candidatus Dadabacteria bacterium]